MAVPRDIRRDTSLAMYEFSQLWPCPLHGKNNPQNTQVITPMGKTLLETMPKTLLKAFLKTFLKTLPKTTLEDS